MCDDSSNDAGGGEGGTVVNSLDKKIMVNWSRKDLEKIKKAVSDWDNEKFDCVDKNGISFDKNRSKMKVLVEKLESPS